MRLVSFVATLAATLFVATGAWGHDPALSPGRSTGSIPESPEAQGSARNMVAVGHDDLGGRGYNADAWVHEQYAYVGSWGFSDCAGLEATVLSERRRGRHRHAPIRRAPRQAATLASPPATSAEDVVVFQARYGLLGMPRHRGRRDPGLRRRPDRHGHPPRPPGLRRDRSRAARGDRLPWHGLLRARPARAGGPGSRRPRAAPSSTRACQPASTASRVRRAGGATGWDAATSA